MTKSIRILAVVLVLLVLVMSCPMTIFAVDNDYEYTLALLDDGTVKIAKFTGTATEIDIGADIKNYGYTVTAIGDAAFANNSTLEKITMPDTINSIGCEAFMYCTKLKNITLSQNVSLLDWNVFEGCYALESILIPEGVTTIDFQAFNKCSALKSISIPKSVNTIEAQAFKDCTSLTDVYYSGSESEWNNINISSTANNWLIGATKHFSFCGIKQVALGGYHSAALTDDGDLYMWGDNSKGQLGNGTTVDSLTPIKILTGVESVELGSYHSAAIMKNGDLYMWGANAYGELGIGTYTNSTIPVKVMSDVSKAILPKDNDSWRVAAITESNDLYMWGYNSNGELGNGSSANCSTPQKILSNVAKVEFGVCHTAAISQSGTLYMWGCNDTYRLGDGSETYRYSPVSVLNGVADVKLGTENSAAITTTGVMYTWGSNWYGQIGMNNHTAYARKVPYSVLSDVKEISLADNTTIALTNSGKLYGWGLARFNTFGPQDYDYAPVQYADNISSFVSIGWLLNGYAIDNNNNLLSFNGLNLSVVLENVKYICSGEEGTYAALTNNNELYMWGDNSSGQIGNGTTSEKEAITKVILNGSNQENEPIEDFTPSLKYGADHLSFGETITGYIGDTIDTLVVYTTKEENIASLDITSSNTDVVEIGTIEIGVGDYITTSQDEHIATIPLKLKAEGTSTITITSPEGVSTSVGVISKKSCYEIKLYSEIPAMIVGKGRKIGAAVQLENNGTVFEENINTSYSFVSSNNDIVTLSDIRKESDGTYFTINGVKEGTAIITITENNTGAVFSGIVQVNPGILTFNAEAMPSYYDRNNEYNGYIGGMYIDEFKMTEKNSDTMSVTFNVYNTANIVGAVDIYDSNGNIIRSEQIKRFDGGYVTSIKDTLISGYKLVEDTFITKNLLTYKQDNYSVKTSIEIEVPKGGHIEITDDPLYSNTCAIFNYTEFITTSIMLFGDVVSVDADTKKEISEITGKNIVDKFLKEYIAAISGKSCNEKIAKLGEKFIEKLTEKSLEKILSSSITGDLASFVDEGKAILEECDINLGDTIVSAAGSIGISIAESTLKKAMGPFGEVLNGMFKFSEYASYSNFLVDICKSHENHALRVYFDNENGCLVSNGVSIKSQNGATSLSENNFILHSVVLSNDTDLTNEVKNSLDDISNDYVVRDIYLERDGVVSQPGQTVQVYMPIPDNYDPNKCKLYWVKDDGTLEQKGFTIVGNNIMFTTEHFSYWALVNENTSESVGLLGDVNGDGFANGKDGVLLAQYLAEWDVTVVDAAADCNGDGIINGKDGVLLAQYLAEWDVTLG